MKSDSNIILILAALDGTGTSTTSTIRNVISKIEEIRVEHTSGIQNSN